VRAHTHESTRAHTRVRTPFELHTTRAGVHICHCLQIKLGAMGAFNEDEEEAASEKPGRSGSANAGDDVDAHLDSLKDMSPSKRAAQLHEVCLPGPLWLHCGPLRVLTCTVRCDRSQTAATGPQEYCACGLKRPTARERARRDGRGGAGAEGGGMGGA
jgi:hypothetical protein